MDSDRFVRVGEGNSTDGTIRKQSTQMKKAQTMATKAGVWIDHKQAIVVLMTDAGQEIKKIPFDIGQPVRSTGGGRSMNAYKPNDFVAEDTLERRVANDRKDYYNDVIASMRGAAAILILGPGEAKGELLKRIKSKKLFSGVMELETTDKMTERQIAAKVRQHFTAVATNELTRGKKLAPKKSAPKKVTPKNAAKVSSGKRTKKPGK